MSGGCPMLHGQWKPKSVRQVLLVPSSLRVAAGTGNRALAVDLATPAARHGGPLLADSGPVDSVKFLLVEALRDAGYKAMAAAIDLQVFRETVE